MSKELENTSPHRANQILPVALLVIVCVVVYFNSLFNGFVFDDRGTIVENKYIVNLIENLPSFFNSSYFKIAELEESYRPVATFSYHLLYAIFELNPFGYHLGSLILHILNVILVYALMNLVQNNKTSSLVSALLFACHPVLTEAVNGISFNEDLLATLFFLLSFIFYIRLNPEDKKIKISYFLLSLIFYLLGLLSKEMAITLPAVIFLYDIIIRQTPGADGFVIQVIQSLKHRFFLYLGYAAVGIFYLCLNFVIIVKPTEGQHFTDSGIGERLLYLPYQIFNFIRLAILPINLSADYVYSYPKNFFALVNIFSVIVVTAIVISSFAIYKKSKVVVFGIWWFLITLSPVYNLIEIFNPVADRYLYLPLVGFCMVISMVFTDLMNRRLNLAPRKSKIVMLSLIIALLAIYSTMTIARNRDWKDGLSLWSKTLETAPNSATAHGNLGHAYLEHDLVEEAIHEFNAVLRIKPQSYKAHYNLGIAYQKKGLIKEAVQQFEKTLNLKSDYASAHFNLGNIYKQMSLLDKAITAYKNLIEIDPEDIEAHNNLGVAYAMQGKLDNAIMEWKNVLNLDPDNHNAADNIRKANEIINKNP
jgi:Tfp pilus assembly protein PilF